MSANMAYVGFEIEDHFGKKRKDISKDSNTRVPQRALGFRSPTRA